MRYVVMFRNSWSHIIIQVGRVLRRPFVPTPYLNRTQQEQVAQDEVQWSSDCFQWRRHHSLSGNLLRCFTTHMVEIFFLVTFWNFLCCNWYPLPLVLLVYTSKKSLDLSSLCHTTRQLNCGISTITSSMRRFDKYLLENAGISLSTGLEWNKNKSVIILCFCEFLTFYNSSEYAET